MSLQSIWTKLIDSELEKAGPVGVELKVDNLSSKLKSLARLYSSNPSYFPLGQCVCMLNFLLLYESL